MPEEQVSTEKVTPVMDTGWLNDADELPPRPRRRLITPVPLTLFGVLLIVCGFIAGVLVEKGQTSSSATGENSGLATRFAALRAGGGARGLSGATTAGAVNGTGASFGASPSTGRLRGALGSGRVTIGQVSYIDGDTLYVESAEGNTVKVTASAGASVIKTTTSTIKAIHPGETVVIAGTTNGKGAVAASSINVGGAGGGLGSGLGALFGGAREGTGGNAGALRRGATGSSEVPTLFGK